MQRYVVLNLNRKEDAVFFGDKFLKDHTEWAKEKKKKEEELESVLELSAISSSEVHTGNISDTTQKVAMEEMRIESSINRLETYEEIMKYALSRITEEHRKILEAFYFTKDKLISALVHELADEFQCSERSIYNQKREALLEFVHHIRVFVDL